MLGLHNTHKEGSATPDGHTSALTRPRLC
jgi:hypothetical protein